MGSFYSGFGGHKMFLGHCDDGIIYSGSGKSNPIGRYENGNIYNQFKQHIGSYSGGSIYDVFNNHIASYNGGMVYNKYSNSVLGKSQVGSYDGDPAEAAALVLLFLGGDNINKDTGFKRDEDKGKVEYKDDDVHVKFDSDSNTGCLGEILFGIFDIICGIIGLLFKVIIKPLFFMFMLPGWVGVTLAGQIAAILTVFAVVAGLIPIAFIVLIAIFALFLLFIPYWFILIKLKMTRMLTWGEVSGYYGKWFLKGPAAYVDLVTMLNRLDAMPKAARTITNAIEKVNKTFKKNK